MRCCFCNFHCSWLSSWVETMTRIRTLLQKVMCVCVCVCVCVNVCVCVRACAYLCVWGGFPNQKIESISLVSFWEPLTQTPVLSEHIGPWGRHVSAEISCLSSRFWVSFLWHLSFSSLSFPMPLLIVFVLFPQAFRSPFPLKSSVSYPFTTVFGCKVWAQAGWVSCRLMAGRATLALLFTCGLGPRATSAMRSWWNCKIIFTWASLDLFRHFTAMPGNGNLNASSFSLTGIGDVVGGVWVLLSLFL